MSLGRHMSVDTATVLVYCVWSSTVCVVVMLVGLAIFVLPRALKQQCFALVVRTWLWELVCVFRPRPHVYAPKVKAVVAERREKRAKDFMMLMILVATYTSLDTSLWLISISPGDRVRVVVDHFAYFGMVMPVASIVALIVCIFLAARSAHRTDPGVPLSVCPVVLCHNLRGVSSPDDICGTGAGYVLLFRCRSSAGDVIDFASLGRCIRANSVARAADFPP